MIKEYVDMLIIEGKMTIKSRLQYKTSIISDIFIISIAFIIVLNSNNESVFQEAYGISKQVSKFLLLIGFLFWQFGIMALGFSTSLISSEASTGRLELKVQGKYSILSLSFYKMVVSLLTDILCFVVLIILYSFTNPITSRELGYVFLSFIVSIPTIIGMYGIGLLMSSFAIKEKSVSSLVLIIQTLLIFVTNVVAPISNQILLIIPFSGGIEIMRALFVSNVINYQLLSVYIFVNICWLLLGVFVFKKVLLNERKYGSFDTY